MRGCDGIEGVNVRQRAASYLPTSLRNSKGGGTNFGTLRSTSRLKGGTVTPTKFLNRAAGNWNMEEHDVVVQFNVVAPSVR